MSKTATVIYTLIFVLILSLLGGLFFIYSGLFDVSARWQDPALVKWVLETTRERSIEVRMDKVEVPDNLDDPRMVLSGFRKYREMCVICHRSPGRQDSELARGLNPKPPNFAHLEEDDVNQREFFLIIRDGIRMTAMPAWGVTHSDEKIWSLVAFLQKLPNMSQDQYTAMDEQAGPEKPVSHEESDAGAPESYSGDQK